MALLIDNDGAARAILIAAVVSTAAAEVGATALGRARDEAPRRWLRVLGSSLVETSLLRRGESGEADRHTKRVVVLLSYAGLAAAFLAATKVPALRVGANVWPTLVIGATLVVAGAVLRGWAVWTLGRFFRRVVTIETGQTLVRRGPYRWLRHPAYTGSLLAFFGIGLALGSWVGAVICVTLTFVGHLPRIRVEEAELARAFPHVYREHARSTWRLIPGVW